MSGWQIDPRLAADTQLLSVVADIEIRAMRSAPWPWLVLVPRVAGAVELFDLDAPARAALLDLAVTLGARMKAQFDAEKINWGALGNVVSQLHVHVVARHRGDPAWPGPVWGQGMVALEAAAAAEQMARLRGCLPS